MPDGPPWTILKLVQWATGFFSRHHIDSARSEAEILLAHSLGMRRIDLYLNHDQPLDEDELGRFRALIRRRLEREPVAYITGVREFWSLSLAVDPSVLIPRPETECLVEAVLPFLQDAAGEPQRVLDMGTGSGAIVIALAHEHPRHRYMAMDRSIAALTRARENARRHRVDAHIAWFCGDWTAPLAAGRAIFDLIVSNPPYIRSRDIQGLQPEIHGHEPRVALDGSDDGLASLRTIIQSAHHCLSPGGRLALEMGCDQAEAVEAIAGATGRYATPRIIKDYSGLDRVAVMNRI